MDKNFIKIDDLVRQRLTGVEEKEKSGAWMNMRDLLDKEMPQQKRISIFYWRRIFSAVAVLSLLGSVCIGGMELSSFYKNTDNNSTSIAAIVNAAGNDNAALLVSDGNNDEVNATASKGLAASGNNIASDVVASATTGHASANASNTVDSENADVAETHTNVNSNVATVDADAKNIVRKSGKHLASVSKSAANKENNAAGNNSDTQASTNNKSGNAVKNKTAIAYGHPDHTSRKFNNTPSAKQIVATKNKNTDINNSNIASSDITEDPKTSSAPTKNSTNPAAKQISANNASAVGVAVAGSNTIAATDTKKTTLATAQKEAKLEVLNSSAINAGTPTSAVTKETTVPQLAGNNADSKIATSAISQNTNTNKVGNTTTATNNAAQSALVGTGTVSTKGSKVDKVIEKAKGDKFTASTGGLAPKPHAEENNSKPKRVITKIQVHQRTIMLASNVYGNRIDTISIEKVNVDLGFSHAKHNNEEENTVGRAKNNNDAEQTSGENIKSVAKGHKTGRHAATPGAMSNSNQKTVAPAAKAPKGANVNNNTDPSSSLSANQSEQKTSQNDDNYEEVVPGASAGSNEEMPETTTKESVTANAAATSVAATQEHKGLSLVKKLSAAFNDVKESASRAHMVGGITAGINSNFFGANSFKGFQFGLTANLVFNDTWNIMTEMKYFHRLNNNKSIEDNYYTYTPTSGNQFSKQLLLNSYSFSALHSIEMPVAIRYAKGKFNFYSGGNFLYSFSINTGAETLPTYNVAPVLVNEVGPDNAPKLKEEDFRSRFGIGYLFGFSYRLAPNANLDFRTVQTVWDNSNSTGARTVSGQLYRAPSLQLSIMYRLGGNRHTD